MGECFFFSLLLPSFSLSLSHVPSVLSLSITSTPFSFIFLYLPPPSPGKEDSIEDSHVPPTQKKKEKKNLLTQYSSRSVGLAIRTFFNKVFNFIGIGLSLYLIANIYTCLSQDTIIKNTVRCKFCRKWISEKVRPFFFLFFFFFFPPVASRHS